MNLNFSQTTGAITKDDGRWIATGWAGRGLGKNNPEDQGIRNTGPLPRGVYAVGSWGDHPVVGPNSAALTAISGETYGRSGFYIHGPGTADYGQESKGCIVIPRGMRLMVQAILVEGSTLTVTV